MHTSAKSSSETAGPGSGGPSAPAGRHRVRGWRPRTTRAKAGIAAVAAVGATGLALALVAGPAGASTKPVWSMTAGNIQALSGVDASTTSYFFNTSAAYGAGASLVKTPVQAHYATTPVLSYTSYAQFASDIQTGAITYPYKWVMYDPEDWAATPVGEQQDLFRSVPKLLRETQIWLSLCRVIESGRNDATDVCVKRGRQGHSQKKYCRRI